MRIIGSMVSAAVLSLGLSVFVVSCSGGGGGDSGPTITPISTVDQGAQSATATVRTFRSMSSVGTLMVDMAGFGGLGPGPVQIGSPASQAATAVDKFAARFAPAAKRAKAMRASATGYPMAMSCANGSTVAPGSINSMTMDVDASGTAMSMTFNSCKEGNTLTDGSMTISGSQNSNTATISIGTDARPFIETTYSSSTSTAVDEITTAVVTISITATSQSAQTQSVSMAANGYFDDVDYVAHTHEKQTVNNFSFAGTMTDSAETIGGLSYDVATLTLNGSMTETTYASDIDSTVSYQKGNKFTNVVIADKHPSSSAGDEYFSINGTLSISATPADRCIDGTFSITTNAPVQIDALTGQTKAGQITINGNAVATFNSDGSISVSIDGGVPVVYSQTELDSMCAL